MPYDDRLVNGFTKNTKAKDIATADSLRSNSPSFNDKIISLEENLLAVTTDAKREEVRVTLFRLLAVVVHTTDDTCGETAPHRTAEHGHVFDVRVLLKLGSNVNAIAEHGGTPLSNASTEHGHLEIIQLLVNARANLEVSDNVGYTPWVAVAHNRDVEAVDLVLNAGANISVADDLRYAALQATVSDHWDDSTEKSKNNRVFVSFSTPVPILVQMKVRTVPGWTLHPTTILRPLLSFKASSWRNTRVRHCFRPSNAFIGGINQSVPKYRLECEKTDVRQFQAVRADWNELLSELRPGEGPADVVEKEEWLSECRCLYLRCRSLYICKTRQQVQLQL